MEYLEYHLQCASGILNSLETRMARSAGSTGLDRDELQRVRKHIEKALDQILRDKNPKPVWLCEIGEY